MTIEIQMGGGKAKTVLAAVAVFVVAAIATFVVPMFQQQPARAGSAMTPVALQGEGDAAVVSSAPVSTAVQDADVAGGDNVQVRDHTTTAQLSTGYADLVARVSERSSTTVTEKPTVASSPLPVANVPELTETTTTPAGSSHEVRTVTTQPIGPMDQSNKMRVASRAPVATMPESVQPGMRNTNPQPREARLAQTVPNGTMPSSLFAVDDARTQAVMVAPVAEPKPTPETASDIKQMETRVNVMSMRLAEISSKLDTVLDQVARSVPDIPADGQASDGALVKVSDDPETPETAATPDEAGATAPADGEVDNATDTGSSDAADNSEPADTVAQADADDMVAQSSEPAVASVTGTASGTAVESISLAAQDGDGARITFRLAGHAEPRVRLINGAHANWSSSDNWLAIDIFGITNRPTLPNNAGIIRDVGYGRHDGYQRFLLSTDSQGTLTANLSQSAGVISVVVQRHAATRTNNQPSRSTQAVSDSDEPSRVASVATPQATSGPVWTVRAISANAAVIYDLGSNQLMSVLVGSYVPAMGNVTLIKPSARTVVTSGGSITVNGMRRN